MERERRREGERGRGKGREEKVDRELSLKVVSKFFFGKVIF